MASYPFNEIEPKWQKFWQENDIYRTGEDLSKPKFYILDMFPYPSGSGLHIGHPEGYTATDITARFMNMKGFNVLHPMGFDAFGLPTERYSMTTGIHPIEATKKNIEVFKNQLNMLGLGYDWDRQVNTTDPDYYKWTQWMFLKIYNSWYDAKQDIARDISELPVPDNFKTQKEIDDYIDSQRLAYIAMIPVNWCEELGTVLANEEVDEWREKGYTVERRPMRQWMVRITAYAQRLLDDLKLVDWPHSTLEMQKNWIGRSEGGQIVFKIEGSKQSIKVFTTRPDTVFGATYLVLAPEHELVNEITDTGRISEIHNYVHMSAMKSDLERTELNTAKTGVFTGAYAINPANNKKIEIWIADYVLAHYGTGAIMAVPGHDERDHEFAIKMNQPVIQVVKPLNGDWDIHKEAFTDDGININSENEHVSLNGLTTAAAKSRIISWLTDNKIGEGKIQFKLRDWLFSRQRYWGEPIPIMYLEDGSRRALDISELPLELPDVQDFKPAGTGESPLAKVDSWINFVDKKTGLKARYETNTMPQWAGSCWYYLRYIDPHNNDLFCSADKEKYWMADGGVDLYVGGAEHAVLHLLYARFWHKLLYDYGYVSSKEPFRKLFHQGLIMGLSYRNKNNVLIANDHVEERDGKFYNKNDGEVLEEIVAKMSKSLKNVISPDEVIKDYGADSLRLFEMFLGPLQDAKPWSRTGIEGVHRFLNRVWRMIVAIDGNLSASVKDVPLNPDQEFVLHSTIKKIAEDIAELHFNTSVSQMMIFLNEFSKYEIKPREAIEKFVLCLYPFAPHIGEELWHILGHNESIVLQNYPEFDAGKITRKEIEIVIQVTSKIRAKLQMKPGATEKEVLEAALNDANAQRFIENKPVRKVIFVQDKLINIIV